MKRINSLHFLTAMPGIIRRTAICLLLALTAQGAYANDGVYFTKGNQLVPLVETDISVRKEILTIRLMDDGFAHVDVYYEFWNPGQQSKRVLMGFEADPSYNDDWKFHPSGVHPHIKNFTVEMNGAMLSYANAACRAGTGRLEPIDTTKQYEVWGVQLFKKGFTPEESENAKGTDFAYVYYFNADFKPGLNRVHHTYTYRTSFSVGCPYVVDYKLTPATRWANGQIDDFTLVIRADNTAKHFSIPTEVFPSGFTPVSDGTAYKMRTSKLWDTPCYEFALRNGAITLHLTNFKPTKELSITGAGWDKCYENHLFHVAAAYDRSRSVILFENIWAEELDPKDKAFCQRVLRNLPYAHRGHVFRDARLRRFFESQWWYMPDPNYIDDTSDFTPVDHYYIQLGQGK